MVLAIAAGCASILAGTAQGQATDPYIEVDQDSWWQCIAADALISVTMSCAAPIGPNRQYGPYFFQATDTTSEPGWCCTNSAIHIAKGTEVAVGGDFTIEPCSGVSVSMNAKKTLSTSEAVDALPFPCGCMVLTGQQNYCVYVSEYRANYCTFYSVFPRPLRWWKHYVIPAGSPTLAVEYYANPARCNCAVDVPYDNPNPQAVQPAPTVPPLPRRVQRPWDPNTDGTPPNPDGTWPTQGPPLPGPSSVEFTVDLNGTFDDRNIRSALDLNLFECRAIATSLYDELAQTGAHVGWDTPTTVIVTRTIRLTGTLGEVIKDLRNFASDRVHSKRYGDFDGDGQRTAADLQLLQDAIINPPNTVAKRRLYDVDGDDELTANDATAWVAINSH